MDNTEKKYVCRKCGFASNSKFNNDICPRCQLIYWKCGNCGYLVTSERPPDICPSCKQKCEFNNVTCYKPDCGGPGNIDPQLF